MILIILHISVSINHGYVQQVHKAKDICIPAWLLSCLKCWQSHGSNDHTQTPKSIKASFNSYWILLEHFLKPPFFFLNIWVFIYTAVLPAQQQYLPRISSSILNTYLFFLRKVKQENTTSGTVLSDVLYSVRAYTYNLSVVLVLLPLLLVPKHWIQKLYSFAIPVPSSTQVHVKRQEARTVNFVSILVSRKEE